MKLFFITLLVLFSTDPREIAKANELKKGAEEAFLSKDYELAAQKYRMLLDSMEIADDLVQLNLGHAYYHLGDTAAAKLSYGKVGMSPDKRLKSIAYQQLGVMSKEADKLKQSLAQLKSAIKADPTNREAIYNYEVVKKLLEEQQQQQQDQDNKENKENEEQNEEQNQDQQNEDQQNQDGEKENEDQKGENQEQSDQQNEDQEQQEGEQQEQENQEGEQEEQKSQEEMTKEKLQEMGISEEKARQLLEAMRQSEIKYLQNQKRKATKRPPSGKPDW